MIYFASDYSQGAHPKVMDALVKTNMEHTDGYGMDEYCKKASDIIKNIVKRDCEVHMMVGGTPCNAILIANSLRPYESVITVKTGHIYSHETGAIEATGHRVVAMDGVDGKINPELIDLAYGEFQDEHTIRPKMVYISQPTEIGTIYKKEEIKKIREKCLEKDMYLYIDGARLGAALTCEENDTSIEEISELCDAFYIGGTKNGALLGEALVIFNEEMNKDFRFMIKRHCGLLARGRIIGVQFVALMEGGRNSLFYEIGRHENEMAEILRGELKKLGIKFFSDSPTNQIFPILPVEIVESLEEKFKFHRWAEEKDGYLPIRLVTSWGTSEDEVRELIEKVREGLNK